MSKTPSLKRMNEDRMKDINNQIALVLKNDPSQRYRNQYGAYNAEAVAMGICETRGLKLSPEQYQLLVQTIIQEEERLVAPIMKEIKEKQLKDSNEWFDKIETRVAQMAEQDMTIVKDYQKIEVYEMSAKPEDKIDVDEIKKEMGQLLSIAANAAGVRANQPKIDAYIDKCFNQYINNPDDAQMLKVIMYDIYKQEDGKTRKFYFDEETDKPSESQ